MIGRLESTADEFLRVLRLTGLDFAAPGDCVVLLCANKAVSSGGKFLAAGGVRRGVVCAAAAQMMCRGHCVRGGPGYLAWLQSFTFN